MTTLFGIALLVVFAALVIGVLWALWHLVMGIGTAILSDLTDPAPRFFMGSAVVVVGLALVFLAVGFVVFSGLFWIDFLKSW